METVTKRLYEGMFLIDSNLAARDWQKVNDEIQRMMGRAGADVVSLKKWDDRRLCYDIRGTSRGTYILVYFNCDPERIHGIERDVHLSEIILRVLILRTDKMSEEDIEKPTPAEAVAAQAKAIEESRAKEDSDSQDEGSSEDDKHAHSTDNEEDAQSEDNVDNEDSDEEQPA